MRSKRVPWMGRGAAWLALVALTVQALLPSAVVVSWAGAPSAAAIELVLCTPEGPRRLSLPADDDEREPRSAPAPFCPLCLVAQSATALPAQPAALRLPAALGTGAASPLEAPRLRPACTTVPPPARGPPTA